MKRIGFTFPLASSPDSGYLQMTSDELAAAKENLKSLLLTNHGERPMRYGFGCNFIEFLFETMSSQSELKLKIQERIISQVSTYLPYLVIEKVDVMFGTDSEDPNVLENAIKIFIGFRLVNKPDVTDSLTLAIA